MRESDWQQAGFRARVGFGQRPSVVVVDTTEGFTNPESPCGTEASDVVSAIAVLIAAAREAGHPVIFTTISYAPADEPAAAAFLAKAPAGGALVRGGRWEAIDSRVAPLEDEPVLHKLWPSAFFGTPLATQLTARGIDTLIVAGLSTSGCVRATVLDGMQHGYKVIVAEETVGDRNPSAHRANLLDMDSKYADVMSLEEVVAKLRTAAV